ncbi:hypothetical protein F5Y07DRAFT_394077 [Xylaria sp. FL0933]|nr:hypothetical protein F5Y07DRAFT_394077 [Xylaria sp. FL0933]
MPHGWGHASGLMLSSSRGLGVAVEMPRKRIRWCKPPSLWTNQWFATRMWYLAATLSVPHLQEVPETDRIMIGFDIGSVSVCDRINVGETLTSSNDDKKRIQV